MFIILTNNDKILMDIKVLSQRGALSEKSRKKDSKC
jgi:hypothetical protein